MVVVLKDFNKIPEEWLEENYSDIKEELGFGYSDDRVNTNDDEAMTDEEVEKLQSECVKRYNESPELYCDNCGVELNEKEIESGKNPDLAMKGLCFRCAKGNGD